VPRKDDSELSSYEYQELIGEFREGQDGDRFWFVVGPVKDQPEWVTSAEFDVSGGDLRLRKLVIEPKSLRTPDSGLTTNVLRSIRIGDLYKKGRSRMKMPPPYGPWFGVGPNEFHRVPHPGRRGRPDSFYAQWAREYLVLVRLGPKPLKRLAQKRKVSESQARSFLYEARRRDLLTDSLPGTAGGTLTEKAKAILRRDNGDSQEAGK